MIDPIFVSRPTVGPRDRLLGLLDEILESGTLTNFGQKHGALSEALAGVLGTPQISLTSSGTAALLAALQATGPHDEVITTPYTFVATTHAIRLLGGTPVFVDVDPSTGNLVPELVEAAITQRTTAILPVHCYGFPCDVDGLERIGEEHGIPVIFDAAHAFGVQHRGRSLLSYGTLSIVSFHATKVFHTLEGGAVITHSPEMRRRIELIRNFGIEDETTVSEVGFNGKMNEFSAAIGLLQLERIEDDLERRRAIDAVYRTALSEVVGARPLEWPRDTVRNAAYFPIVVEDEYPLTRDGLNEYLKARGIFARRYFYPLTSDYPPYSATGANTGPLVGARWLTERILCLPIHPELTTNDQERVISALRLGGS